MATITTGKLATLFTPPAYNTISGTLPTSIPGLPVRMATRGCRVRCSLEERATEATEKNHPSTKIATSMVAAAAASASAMAATGGAAMALVDERMSTEGTGLPFGLSNNLLGWILLGVFALIWSLYTVYTSTLEEDDDSALSL